jgi:hypothetical protein
MLPRGNAAFVANHAILTTRQSIPRGLGGRGDLIVSLK